MQNSDRSKPKDIACGVETQQKCEPNRMKAKDMYAGSSSAAKRGIPTLQKHKSARIFIDRGEGERKKKEMERQY